MDELLTDGGNEFELGDAWIGLIGVIFLFELGDDKTRWEDGTVDDDSKLSIENGLMLETATAIAFGVTFNGNKFANFTAATAAAAIDCWYDAGRDANSEEAFCWCCGADAPCFGD